MIKRDQVVATSTSKSSSGLGNWIWTMSFLFGLGSCMYWTLTTFLYDLLRQIKTTDKTSSHIAITHYMITKCHAHNSKTMAGSNLCYSRLRNALHLLLHIFQTLWVKQTSRDVYDQVTKNKKTKNTFFLQEESKTKCTRKCGLKIRVTCDHQKKKSGQHVYKKKMKFADLGWMDTLIWAKVSVIWAQDKDPEPHHFFIFL